MVDSESVVVPTAILVTGFEVSGAVRSTANEPILGVDLLLYSDSHSILSCVSSAIEVPSSIKGISRSFFLSQIPGGKPPLCVTQSDNDGSFKFSNIPCGEKYEIFPLYRGTTTTYDVIPASQTFSVYGKLCGLCNQNRECQPSQRLSGSRFLGQWSGVGFRRKWAAGNHCSCEQQGTCCHR